MRTAGILGALLALSLVACGAAAPPAPVAPPAPAAVEAQAVLDWATLLPIDTLGFLRIDLARLRRSSHRAALESLFDGLLEDIDDGALRQRLESVLERTELMLIAMVPSGEESEALLFARGAYHPDELERLDEHSPERSVPIDVGGQRVWISGEADDTSAMSLLSPDTLVFAGTRGHMEGVIARTRMASGSPRWPQSVRGLVEELDLEQATIGLAMARQDLAGGEGENALFASVVGRADLDGPLSIDVSVELDDPLTAMMMATVLDGMVQAAGRSAGSMELRHLAELARIEAIGTRVSAALHADEETTGRMVPALIQLLRDEAPAGALSPGPLSPGAL